jgi:Na+-driven multidrug efflux pump
MLVLGGLLIAISPFAPRTFTSNSDVARLSTIYLVLVCASEPFLGLAITLLNFIMELATPWFQWILTPSFY